MDLHESLLRVVELEYSHRDSKLQPAQQALYQLRREKIPGLPFGLELRVSGQGQSLPVVPWIALLDPDVTRTATSGQYLVYLYTQDLTRVYLTLNQGATAHRTSDPDLKGRAAERKALAEIDEETKAIRDALHLDYPSLPYDHPNLGASLFLPQAYELGAVASKAYSTKSLPESAVLLADLETFNVLYQRAVHVKKDLVAGNPARFRTPVRAGPVGGLEPEPMFRPKSSEDYWINVPERIELRHRRHESLVEEFGAHVSSRGYVPATNVHPRDLVIQAKNGGPPWLVEAKTVGANAELAVRAAIGQLMSYRYFYYTMKKLVNPRLLALFNAQVGDAFLGLLVELQIEAVWRAGERWEATAGAQELI